MRTYASLATVSIVFLSLLITGCPPKVTGPLMPPAQVKDYSRQLPEGELALRRITNPNDIPDFSLACTNLVALRESIDNSLDYLAKPSSQKHYPYGKEITHAQVVASLKAFETLLDKHLPPEQMNQQIREMFDVYISVGCDNVGTVLFTGYYTPIFDASPTRTEKFKYPIYKMPADLVKDAEGKILGRKMADGTTKPYPDRREIEISKMLAGNELYWLADPFEVFIAHVQGSAQLRMADGRMVTVGYTANSGQDYHSVAMELVKEGKIPKDKLSLRAMIDYFHAHPNEINDYTWRNPRYVFFAEITGGPRGCLNEPVTRQRSIAADKSIFPRAALTFVSTSLPRRIGSQMEILPFRGFGLDQDAGGAIRAPGRCDVYMGIGQEAGELAGRTYEEGNLYYLFLKPSYMNATAAAAGPGASPAAAAPGAAPAAPRAASK